MNPIRVLLCAERITTLTPGSPLMMRGAASQDHRDLPSRYPIRTRLGDSDLTSSSAVRQRRSGARGSRIPHWHRARSEYRREPVSDRLREKIPGVEVVGEASNGRGYMLKDAATVESSLPLDVAENAMDADAGRKEAPERQMLSQNQAIC
jgi:hypothetical protein